MILMILRFGILRILRIMWPQQTPLYYSLASEMTVKTIDVLLESLTIRLGDFLVGHVTIAANCDLSLQKLFLRICCIGKVKFTDSSGRKRKKTEIYLNESIALK